MPVNCITKYPTVNENERAASEDILTAENRRFVLDHIALFKDFEKGRHLNWKEITNTLVEERKHLHKPRKPKLYNPMPGPISRSGRKLVRQNMDLFEDYMVPGDKTIDWRNFSNDLIASVLMKAGRTDQVARFDLT